ncbi:sugar ABC transporter ATP-binding protein [Aquibium sp. A9E412]|uniref:sugar ABC transporter ATP-binding protein n=1 Tax=Aquibium sp. A9E412 TaxID=2976767 RepID=UPI0025B0C584|nr:sugar ABC transporter ATP-binding protein [Aquibium sp. A9E412]MDN2568315.1 sugar ABC transporter ATP-binding protein [Aquibium sp. A9E412]
MSQHSDEVPALEIRDLSKRFGGAVALDGVSLTVRQGEVHGLLGQNGSGKSTLIKILSGFHEPAPGGRLRLYGRDVPLPLAPGQFRSLGLAFVHQHLGLVPSLSVTENICLSDFATGRNWHIDWQRETERIRNLFADYDLAIEPTARIAELPQVDRCLVAIVRALEEVRSAQESHGGHGILVLDEPTPFLPRAGVERLFGLVRQVVANGASVVFVSHDVDEILDITDRATVLRDGRVAGTVVTHEARPQDFIEMIVGQRVEHFHADHRDGPQGEPAVVVEGLTGAVCRDLTLRLGEGEVLGLTGLIGSGFDEVPALIYGAAHANAGSLTIGGRRSDLARMTPEDAVRRGIAYLPADRLGASGAGSLPVADNLTLPSLDRFMAALGLRRSGMREWSATVGRQHQVKPNDPAMYLQNLSGGNQQKVLLAKWLEIGPRLLLLDEPTQGVDVGARQQVFAAIDRAAKDGTVVICASTDAEQLAQICDRVLVMAHGRVAAELTGTDVTKETITYHCYSGLALNQTALID